MMAAPGFQRGRTLAPRRAGGKPSLAKLDQARAARDVEGTFEHRRSAICSRKKEIRFMAKFVERRVRAEMDGGVVIFMIGMRVNKPWK
jgi:hypothetical protein